MQAEYITSWDMRALETNAEYFGVSLLQLMENAGRNVALEVNSRFKRSSKIVILCGLGGNGGDGFVAARHLSAMGFKVKVILVGRSRDINHKDAFVNWCALQPFKESISVFEIADSSAIPLIEADVVVDALLGTGTRGELKPPILNAVECINSLKSTKVSIDVPTGINSDTGDVLGKAVKADITVTFYKAKKGLETAKKHAGEVVIRDIGLPPALERFAGPGDVILATKKRSSSSHKGDSGRLLVIGGSELFSGAPTLVSLAALRTGVDIVYTAAPERTAHDIASLSPDLITLKLEGTQLNRNNLSILKTHLDTVDAVVLGPGAGLHPDSKTFVKSCIKAVEDVGKPLLLDADGLKSFADFKRRLTVPLVLTPHAGEFEIITGKKLSDNFDERVTEVQKTAKVLGAVILLKGNVDVVSDGDHVKLNFTGNPGMTVGGTGDILAGIVGGLLSQKVNAFEAAVAGSFINGAAGDFVAAEVGHHMVASDLLEWIPQIMNDPMSHIKVRNVSGKKS